MSRVSSQAHLKPRGNNYGKGHAPNIFPYPSLIVICILWLVFSASILIIQAYRYRAVNAHKSIEISSLDQQKNEGFNKIKTDVPSIPNQIQRITVSYRSNHEMSISTSMLKQKNNNPTFLTPVIAYFAAPFCLRKV